MTKLITLFLLSLQITYAYINIYPLSFDKKIDDEGSYQEYSLFNQTNKPIFYRVYVEKPSNSKDRDMSKWINYFPHSLTLKPGEEGIIKINIASYEALPEGEYSAILGIREIPVYEEEIKKEKSSITVYTDFKLVLNGYAGNIFPKLEIKNIGIEENSDRVTLKGTITNIGKRQGRYKIYLDEYFLGNLRLNKGDSLEFKENEFYYLKDKNYKRPKKLVIKDFDSDEEIKIFKLR